MPGRIFVCYRREDSGGYSGRLYDRLNQRFPADVFRDADTLALAERWTAAIEQTLSGCEVGIVVIGPRWLEPGVDGRCRLDNANDPVRGEIAALLQLKVPIVPVLVGGATIPPADLLPLDIRSLTDWQALRIDDDDFDHDSGRLLQTLENRFRTARAPAAASTAAPAPVDPAPPRTVLPWREATRRWKQGEPDLPFLMGVEDIFSIQGRGTVVTGTIRHGRVRLADRVELAGIRPVRTVSVEGIELSRKLVDEGRAGDTCGVLLGDVGKEDVVVGQVLAAPGAVQVGTTFAMSVHLLAEDEGGTSRAITSGQQVDLWMYAVNVPCRVAIRDAQQLSPGGDAILDVTLRTAMAIAPGVLVALRSGDTTIGIGTILD